LLKIIKDKKSPSEILKRRLNLRKKKMKTLTKTLVSSFTIAGALMLGGVILKKPVIEKFGKDLSLVTVGYAIGYSHKRREKELNEELRNNYQEIK